VDCRVAILAGGLSTRLGRPKATAELAGRPLIDYPLAAAQAAGLEAVVVAKAGSDLPPLGVPVLIEPAEPQHPLCGVLAALRESGRPVLAVACDMPFLAPDLLAWLASQPEPLVVAETDRGLQPLLARYDPVLTDALELGLRREAAMQELVASLNPRAVGVRVLRRFGDPQRLCFNVNSPSDLARAERMLAAARA
jgi:molybdopterin-guanine dinucleotide biosynthesis protein A